MSVIKICIEREGEQKYEAQMDCTKNSDKNMGDDKYHVSFLILRAIEAVFGGEGDFFGVYDILIECLAYHNPPYMDYDNLKSIFDFFYKLQKVWGKYEDNGDFLKYFQEQEI